MAARKSTTESAPNTAPDIVSNQNTEKAEVKEQKYTKSKLREKSIILFDVSQSTFDGAMYGHDEKEYTITEARHIIDEWLYGKGGKK